MVSNTYKQHKTCSTYKKFLTSCIQVRHLFKESFGMLFNLFSALLEPPGREEDVAAAASQGPVSGPLPREPGGDSDRFRCNC